MSEQAVQGMGCPRCGGIVPIPEGQVLVNCPYCDQRSVVSGERGIQRYQVPGRIDREQAEKAARGFMNSSSQIAPSVKNQAQITEVFLVHLPFWTAWGRGVAWGFGQVKVGSGDDARYEAREKKVIKDLTWNGVACDVGEFGVQRISLQDRPLEPFNSDRLHETGMVFEPIGSDVEALERAREAFQATVKDDVKLDRMAQLFTRILSPHLGVVYYPVWVARYVFRQRSFQVVVDGFDGKVLYGKAPGNLLMRALALVGGMAVGAFLAIDVPALILYTASGDDDLMAIVVGAFLGGLALMVGGYTRFRYGEHYEFNRFKGKDSIPAIRLAGVNLKEITSTLEDFTK
jgi:hypothetical protein